MARRFGCEFEFSSDWDAVEAAVRAAIPRRDLYVSKSHHDSNNNRKWHLKTDATTTAELATPVCSLKDLPRVRRVIGSLRRAGVRTTKEDGFHVHVNIADVDRKKLVAAWLRAERAILSLVPRHRRTNGYCYKLSRGSPPERLFDADRTAEDHHAIISFSRFGDIGTVEIRPAEGTTDAEFAGHWVRLCVGLVEYAKRADPYDILLGKPPSMSLDELMDELRRPP